LEVDARAGAGIDRVRVGGGASVAALVRSLGVGLFASGRWLGSTANSEEITAQWLGGGGGLVAVIVPAEGWLADGKVGYVRERWRVVAGATEQFDEESELRTYDSLEIELGGSRQLGEHLFVRAGVGACTSPAQTVRVSGRALGNNPSLGLYGSLGVFLRI
jgi:hypothetical protein